MSSQEAIDGTVADDSAESAAGAAAAATLTATGVGTRIILTGVWARYDIATAKGTITITGLHASINGNGTLIIPVLGVGGVSNLTLGVPLRGAENADVVVTLDAVASRTAQVTAVGYKTRGRDTAN